MTFAACAGRNFGVCSLCQAGLTYPLSQHCPYSFTTTRDKDRTANCVQDRAGGDLQGKYGTKRCPPNWPAASDCGAVPDYRGEPQLAIGVHIRDGYGRALANKILAEARGASSAPTRTGTLLDHWNTRRGFRASRRLARGPDLALVQRLVRL